MNNETYVERDQVLEITALQKDSLEQSCHGYLVLSFNMLLRKL